MFFLIVLLLGGYSYALAEDNEFNLDGIFQEAQKDVKKPKTRLDSFVDDSKESASEARYDFFMKHEYVSPEEQKRFTQDVESYSEKKSNTHSTGSGSSSKKVTKNIRTTKRIYYNGKVSGVPSYGVECTGGSSYVIYYKNGTWWSGGTGHMGNKYNNWSKEDVAKYLCE